jgi:hypothetical protein
VSEYKYKSSDDSENDTNCKLEWIRTCNITTN